MEKEEIDYSKLSDEELLALEKQYSLEAIKYYNIQYALKILLNSLYGALGEKSFRYFDLSLASSVTISGQHAIRWIERKCNELIDKKTGIKKDRVVLIDTDSVVLNLSDLVNKVCPKEKSREEKLDFLNVFGEKIMNPYLQDSYDELYEYMNAYQNKFKMKRENIINSMVSVATKAYVMEVYNSEGTQYTLEKPKMKKMGLQLVKSSTPLVIRHALEDSLPILLHQQERDLHKYVQQVEENFKKFTVEEIAFPRGLTDISKYDKSVISKMPNLDAETKNKLNSGSDVYIKGTPINARAALLYNSLIDKLSLGLKYPKVKEGDKIKFVYLKMPNPLGENVIAFVDSLPPEFGLHKFVDYNKMFEAVFDSPMQGMADALGWKTHEEISLDDFFV